MQRPFLGLKLISDRWTFIGFKNFIFLVERVWQGFLGGLTKSKILHSVVMLRKGTLLSYVVVGWAFLCLPFNLAGLFCSLIIIIWCHSHLPVSKNTCSHPGDLVFQILLTL